MQQVRSIVCGTGGSLAGHCDLNKADTLYLDALGIMDPLKLAAAVRHINSATYEDYWAIPLASRSEPWAAHPGIVSDWRPVRLGVVDCRLPGAGDHARRVILQPLW
jgi:hypothetical protein